MVVPPSPTSQVRAGRRRGETSRRLALSVSRLGWRAQGRMARHPMPPVRPPAPPPWPGDGWRGHGMSSTGFGRRCNAADTAAAPVRGGGDLDQTPGPDCANRLRAVWATHAPVGWPVIPARCIQRRSSSRRLGSVPAEKGVHAGRAPFWRPGPILVDRRRRPNPSAPTTTQ
jgi:hypothetical protein